MHCLSDEEFGALIENDLAPARREHVATCQTCAETWATLEHADWTLRSAPRRRRSARPFIAAAIAAAAVIGAVAWAVSRPEAPRQHEPAPTAKNAAPAPDPKPEPAPIQEPKKPEEVDPKQPDVRQPEPQPKPPTPEPKKPEEPPGIAKEPKPPDVKPPEPKPPVPEPKKPEEPPGIVKEPKKPVEVKPKEPEKPSADAIAALDNFDKMLRRAGRDESAREGAIVGLRQVRDPFILQRMMDFYEKESSQRVRIAIAQGLGDYRTSEKALKALAGWLSHDGRQGDLDKTILEAMAEFDADDLKAYAKKLASLMAAGDMNVARAAVGVAAVTKDPACIEMLVDQMSVHQLQMRAFIGTDDDGGLDSPVVQELLDKHLKGTLKTTDARVTRYIAIVPAMNTALQKISGQQFKNSKAWREWWEKSRKKDK